ncbi:MAG: hypothetical protein LC739_06045 [Actinobacteria bacterium]|nr:hypothetical protein [Actinomycetota bacterium]
MALAVAKWGLGYMALLTVLLTLGVGGAFVILEDEPIGVGLRTVVVTETLTDVRGEISIGPPKTRVSVPLPGGLSTAAIELAAAFLGAGGGSDWLRMVRSPRPPA